MADILVSLCWLATSLLLVFAAWRIACRLFPLDRLSRLLMHTLILSWATIVLVATSLGILGCLYGYVLVAAVCALASTILWCMRSSGQATCLTRRTASAVCRFADADTKEEAEFASPYLRLTTIALQPDLLDRGQLVTVLIWGMFVCFWVGHVTISGLFHFPSDWDTLNYHLPLVDHWVHARSLLAPDCLEWSSPGTNELLALWLVAPFSGDFLFAFTNLPASLLLAVAALEVARELGLSHWAAHASAVVVVSNSVVLHQLIDCENDVAAAALFFSCVAYVLSYSRQGRPADLTLGGVSLGLLAGVKFYALGYAAIAATAFILGLLRRCDGRTAVRRAGGVALGLFVCGGYWYMRNFVNGGSPLYPIGATIPGTDLRQIYPGIWPTTMLGNGRPELLPLAIQAVREVAGPWHLMAFLGLPFTLAWLLGAGFWNLYRGRCRNGEVRLTLALLTALSGLVLLLTPFAVEDIPGTLNQMRLHYCPVRYGLCFLGLTVLVFAVTFHDLVKACFCLGPVLWRESRLTKHRVRHVATLQGRVLRRAVSGLLLGLFAASIAFQVVAQQGLVPIDPHSVLVGINLFNVLLGLWICLGLHYCQRWKLAIVAALTIAVAGATSTSVECLARGWHDRFAQFYEYRLGKGLFNYLAQSAPPGTRLCVLDYQSYPFFGSRRQIHVCQPAFISSYPYWLDYLRDREIRLIVIRSEVNDVLQRGWKECRSWITKDKEIFTRVQDETWPYEVYRVKPSGPD